MASKRTRIAFALIASLLLLASPRTAVADTLSGTVGALAAGHYVNDDLVVFKFTDPNITKGCDYPGPGWPADYAWVRLAGNAGKEIYALLLVSKKGAPISCVTQGAKANAGGCQIVTCELQ